MDKQSKKSNLVRKYVCSLIEQGLRFGDLLPSVSDICATLHISRMTVLRTLRQMEEEGIVECHKRSGTYVGKAVLYQINPVTIQRKRHSTGKKTITLFSPEPHSSEFAKEIFDGVSAILEDDYTLVKHHFSLLSPSCNMPRLKKIYFFLLRGLFFSFFLLYYKRMITREIKYKRYF